MIQKIILDTNFLLIPIEFKVDIFTEIERICAFPYELCAVEKTITELEKIARTQNRKTAMAAKIGASFLKVKEIHMLSMGDCTTVDDALLFWGKNGAIIATQDKDLKRMLKSHRVRRIVLRKKSFLLLEG